MGRHSSSYNQFTKIPSLADRRESKNMEANNLGNPERLVSISLLFNFDVAFFSHLFGLELSVIFALNFSYDHFLFF
jgi:hypothetical protein